MTVVFPDIADADGAARDTPINFAHVDAAAAGIGTALDTPPWPSCSNTTNASYCQPGVNTFYAHLCGLPAAHLGPHICRNDQYLWTIQCANASGAGVDIHQARPQPSDCSAVGRAGQCIINP